MTDSGDRGGSEPPDAAATIDSLEAALGDAAAALDELDADRRRLEALLAQRAAQLSALRARVDGLERDAAATRQRSAGEPARGAGGRDADSAPVAPPGPPPSAALAPRVARVLRRLAIRVTPREPVAPVPPPPDPLTLDAARWAQLTQHDPDTAAAVVTAIYLAVLGRDPDPDGLSYHVDRLTGGLPLEFLLGEMARAHPTERRDASVPGAAPEDVIGVLVPAMSAVLGRVLDPLEQADLAEALVGRHPWAAAAAFLHRHPETAATRQEHLTHVVLAHQRALVTIERQLAALQAGVPSPTPAG